MSVVAWYPYPMRVRRLAVLVVSIAAVSIALLGRSAPAHAAPPAPLTVFGAADLASAFREVVPSFERAANARVTLVLGSTGNLAKQIEQGAPADVFFAANVHFVEDLARKGAVLPDSRILYARGRLVLATARSSGLAVERLEDLRRPDVRRVAIANPEHAPYGQAAREALVSLGLWEAVRPKLVYGENIRHTLQFLESGAVDAAIVALSIADAPDVRHVPIDPSLHRPIDQAAAVTARSRQPALARAFIAFVTGPEGRAIMTRHGFATTGGGG